MIAIYIVIAYLLSVLLTIAVNHIGPEIDKLETRDRLRKYGPVGIGSIGSFLEFVFPLIRRVWPSLIAGDLVSVQPMSKRLGRVKFF